MALKPALIEWMIVMDRTCTEQSFLCTQSPLLDQPVSQLVILESRAVFLDEGSTPRHEAHKMSIQLLREREDNNRAA